MVRRLGPSGVSQAAGLMARAAGLCLPVLLLGGCGWQLQGTDTLPAVMGNTYVESDNTHSDFDRALRRGLAASGVRVTPVRDGATALLRIRKDESGRRVLSVSAQNTPQEYEVFYAVEYSVEVNGEEVIPRQTLELVNDYSFDESALLAKEREESQLKAALARDLAGIVLRRLAAL